MVYMWVLEFFEKNDRERDLVVKLFLYFYRIDFFFLLYD